MIFIQGGPPKTMETARRMSESLAEYETRRAEPFDHAQIYKDMQQDVNKMKTDLSHMDKLFTGLVPFSDRQDVNKTQNGPMVVKQGGPLLNVDVSMYRPDELAVRAVGNNVLEVVAEHQEKNGLSMSHRKFKRHVQVPPEVDISTIIPTLTADGRLIIEAQTIRN